MIKRGSSNDLAKDSTLATGLELVTAGTAFVSFYILARSLGKTSYGEFAAVYAIVAPLVTLIGIGPALGVLQETMQRGRTLQDSIGPALGAHVALLLPSICVAMVVASQTTSTFPLAYLGALIVSELGVSALLGILHSAVQVQYGFRKKLVLQLASSITRFSLVCTLALAGRLSVKTYFIGHLLSNVVLVSIVFYMLWTRGSRWSPKAPTRTFVQSSLALSLGLFFLGIQADADKLVLSAVGRAAEGGGYTAAYRIVSIALVPIGGLIGATQKRMLVAGRDLKEVKRLTIRFARFSAGYAAIASIVLLAVSPLADELLGSDYSDVPRNIIWLLPLVSLRAISAFPLNGLLSLNALWPRTLLIVGCSICSLAVYSMLIPRYGVEGAAVGTWISEGLLAVGAMGLLKISLSKTTARHAR